MPDDHAGQTAGARAASWWLAGQLRSVATDGFQSATVPMVDGPVLAGLEQHRGGD